jgi:hypothetical protein
MSAVEESCATARNARIYVLICGTAFYSNSDPEHGGVM